jgi:hypothetical protein
MDRMSTETMTRQRRLLIRAGMLDLMLALCEGQVPLSREAAHRVGMAWDAIKLPEDMQCPFRKAPQERARILMPVGETAGMPR